METVETPDRALLERLREVVRDEPVTETELRTLVERADALVRVLGAHLVACERHLDALSGETDSSLADIAAERHRAENLRPRLDEARSLLSGLERRARAQRAAWLGGRPGRAAATGRP